MTGFLFGFIVGFVFGACSMLKSVKDKMKKSKDLEELEKWI